MCMDTPYRHLKYWPEEPGDENLVVKAVGGGGGGGDLRQEVRRWNGRIAAWTFGREGRYLEVSTIPFSL